jgi:hypothetical protein
LLCLFSFLFLILDQETILKNEHSSAHYKEFSASLAWPVNLSTHKGYLGKLEGSGNSCLFMFVHVCCMFGFFLLLLFLCLPCNLSTHKGYLGKLEVRMFYFILFMFVFCLSLLISVCLFLFFTEKTGTTTPYWASPTTEIVFHEVVGMPTVQEDPTQLNKKVNNDNKLKQN